MENKPSIRASLEIEKKEENKPNNTNFSLNQSFYQFMINNNDNNLVNSLWMKRFAKLLVFIFLMIGVWLGKAYGTPAVTVDCLNDPVQNALEYINGFLITNENGARFFQITSSFLMDFTFFSLYIYWVLHAESCRLVMSHISFYVIRAINQILIQMKFPEGYYWDHPGFPSFVVPYGHTSDFFFSGHCGFLMICSLEWLALNHLKMFYFTVGINVYMVFVMLIFRVHYAIDITTGLIVSHYCFIQISKHEKKLNNWFTKVYEMSVNKYLNKNVVGKNDEIDRLAL